MNVEIKQNEDGRWCIYVDGEPYEDYDSQAEAEEAMAALQSGEASNLSEAVTSKDLAERPFMVDGVPLSESQCRRIANLVAGTSRPGGTPMQLHEAIDVWKRQNHMRTIAGKQRWTVHSASPTWRKKDAGAAAKRQVLGQNAMMEGELAEGAILLEAVFTGPRDPEGKTWDIVAIESGWSNNGRYYEPESLLDGVGLFEGARISAYGWDPNGSSYLDHVPPRVRDIMPGGTLFANDVGYIHETRAVESGGRVQILGVYECTDPVLSRRMLEAWQRDPSKMPGFSIDAYGDYGPGIAEGRRGTIVRKLKRLSEVTLVTRPAAGGRFTRLVASEENKEDTSMLFKKLREYVKKRMPRLAEAVEKMEPKPLTEAALTLLQNPKGKRKNPLQEGMSDEAFLKVVRSQIDSNPEVAGQLLDAMLAEYSGEPDGDENPLEAQAVGVGAPGMMEAVQRATEAAVATAEKRIADQEKLFDCRMKLAEATANVPVLKNNETARDIIVKQFQGRVFEAQELTDAIEAVKKLAIREAVGVPGEGDPVMSGQRRGVDVSVVRDQKDKLKAKLDMIFGYRPTEEERSKGLYESREGERLSLRDVYLALTGDYNFSGKIQEGYLQEATTADLPTLLGTSMTKALVQKYEAYPDMYKQLAKINPNIANFMTQDRSQWYGFGRVPTVAEGGTYTDLGFPAEVHTTYSVAKKGGTATITIEMIANDNLQALQDLPDELARAAHNELHYQFFNTMTGNAGGGGVNTDTWAGDSTVIYHANHRNVGTTALSWQTLLQARTRLRKQYRRGSLTALTGNYTAGSVTMSVTSSARLKQFDYIQVNANILQISAITNGTTIAVTGGQLGTTDANASSAAQVWQITQPVPLTKVFLVFPDDLEATVDEILNSQYIPGSANRDNNLFYAEAQKGRIVPICLSSLYLNGTTHNWFQVADPMTRPGIEWGFLNNREQPEVILADMPTVGAMFTNDQLIYKLRHIYGGVVVDPFGLDGSIF